MQNLTYLKPAFTRGPSTHLNVRTFQRTVSNKPSGGRRTALSPALSLSRVDRISAMACRAGALRALGEVLKNNCSVLFVHELRAEHEKVLECYLFMNELDKEFGSLPVTDRKKNQEAFDLAYQVIFDSTFTDFSKANISLLKGVEFSGSKRNKHLEELFKEALVIARTSTPEDHE